MSKWRIDWCRESIHSERNWVREYYVRSKMETKNSHTQLINRKQELTAVASVLKEKFLGLDEVIDEVITLMTPWYLFPHAQRRPTIVNLWGLTGSGKTALVQQIVDSLNYRRLFAHLDMGEFESDSASWMREILSNDLEFFNGKPALICLDEFQFARTIDQRGGEIGKDKLRALWDLLDSGKLEYIPNQGSFYLFRADACQKRLERAVKAGVEVLNGEVVREVEQFTKIFDGFYFEYNEGKKVDKDYFLSDDFLNGFVELINDDNVTRSSLADQIRSSSLREIQALILQAMRSRPATKELDLSNSLIFVLGNLDEAYRMSHSMNPDISADDFHQATKKINVADIKAALLKRFRPEQVARLGNNHIIYPAFSENLFRELIRRELARVAAFMNSEFGWRIIFDPSVEDVVYAEGVFPTQGTRPVLTTVKNLIESRVGNLAVDLLQKQYVADHIRWHFADETFILDIFDQAGAAIDTIEMKVRLKLDSLRNNIDPELQAHTAVHESGHAVLAALTFRIIPAAVVSRTASDAEGFCLVNFPEGPMTRESLRKNIITALGGYVAEKLIFGDEFTSSGVYYDIQEATALATKAVRKFAMGRDPLHLGVMASQDDEALTTSASFDAEAIRIIRECKAEAEAILLRNKLLLLKMAEHLTVNSRMEEEEIREFVLRYGRETWLQTSGFVSREQYYQFNKVLQHQLRAMEEEEDVDKVIQKLMTEVKEQSGL